MRDPTLQATALRFAARDLPPGESAEFEALLATNEDAQDALAEAVRLSAAALGQVPPHPHCSFRKMIRERLRGWTPAWLARRAYRGHPLAWAAAGAVMVAAGTLFAIDLTPTDPAVATAPDSSPLPDVGPEPQAVAILDDHPQTTAEVWAELSTPEHVEKAHDEELRRRQWFREISAHYPLKTPVSSIDSRDP